MYVHELANARRTRPSTRYALTPRPPALLLGYGRIATPAIEAGVRAIAQAAILGNGP
jgi:hypothetical protein